MINPLAGQQYNINTQTNSAYIFTKSHDHIFSQMPNKSAHYWHRFATVVSVGETMSWEPGGGVLLEKLGRGVRRTSQNPYPIYDQNLRFSLPYFIDLYISWSFFKNAQRKFTSWSGGLIWWTLGFCYRFKVVLRVEFSNVITRVAVLSTDEAISASSLLVLVAHYNPLQSSSYSL